MRNRIILFKRYALSSPAWCFHDFYWIFIELAKIVFFEKQKGAQLSNMARGIRDGLAGKTGPVPQLSS